MLGHARIPNPDVARAYETYWLGPRGEPGWATVHNQARISMRERGPALSQIGTWLWGTTLRRILTVTVVWRAVIALAGIMAHFLLPTGLMSSFSLLRLEKWPINPLTLAVDAGVRNDSIWYARIVEHGYTFSTHHVSSIAFYPLYPLLIKLVSLPLGNLYVAGMLISTACLFAAVVLLYQWLVVMGLQDRALWATLLLLSFPWAVFFAAMYTESLYLALALGAFLAAERSRYGWAAVCAFLIALTRPTGILVVPCLAVLFFLRGERSWRAGIAVLSGLVGLAAFGVYQAIAFGTPFASERAAVVPPWSRGIRQALNDLRFHARPGFPSWYLVLMLLIAILMLLAVPLVYRRLGPAYALLALFMIGMPAASGLISIERYAVVDFPVFAALATVQNRLVKVGLVEAGTLFLLFFAAAFEAGWGVF